MSVQGPKGEDSEDSSARPVMAASGAANEERSEPLTRTLNQIRAEAIFALKWWRETDPTRAAPLEPIVAVLSANNLVASEGLGEAGFKSDPENFEVVFNAGVLRSIAAAVAEIFPGSAPLEIATRAEIGRRATALYVFHEITHITQKFVEHELAKSMKAAFTPDELSKIDLVADIRAAHCNALISTAIEGNSDPGVYLNAYRDNLHLSYQLLVRAFSIKDADHKKKRSLGLLTNITLCQSAQMASSADAPKLVELAARPAFTSVDRGEACIVALTCGADGWEILFHGKVATNRMTIPEMWDAAGSADPTDILALLRVAYEQLM